MEGDPVAVARGLVTAFFCISAVIQSFIGPHFNPFSPVHSALYTVTGMGKAEGDPAVRSNTEEKPKED